MPKKVKIAALLIALVAVAVCCKKEENPPQNVQTNCVHSNASAAQVNFAILSGSAQFFPLNNIGGSIYVSGYGLKGIVIYRVSQNQFVAFERSCTYEGCSNTKAKVWMETGNTSLRDSVCKSVFNSSDGSIQQGPATVQLYQYQTAWDGNQLQVFN
jgi:nitrite reductase/ring-hydroxylating ferredoxin subunit